MKLQELKRKLGKKYSIRIVAGILVVALAGTPAAGVLAATAEDAVLTEVEKYKDTEKETGKEETVYVILDSTGKEKEVIVSDHLINRDGKEVIEDASTLKDIENVKGEETYSRSGDGITWKADGSDIFYRGTSGQKLPVSQEITYYLDGKKIAPEELAGKSGEVKIRFDYANHQKVKAQVAGEEAEICVPFVAVSGMVLGDHFSGIRVKNGRVLADGNKTLVLGYAFPGLKESLNVSGEDLGFPEYFEVTADVEDFSLETTMTVVMNAADFVSGEDGKDRSALDELFETLTDAAGELEDDRPGWRTGPGRCGLNWGHFRKA